MGNDFIYKPAFFMPLWITLLLGLTLSCSMCKKTDVPKDDTPRCIKEKIKEDEWCLKTVYEYECNGEIIYYFEYDSCPTFAPRHPFLDVECNNVGGCVLSSAVNPKISGKNKYYFEKRIEMIESKK